MLHQAGETVQRGDHIDVWRLGTTKNYSDDRNLAKQGWFWAAVTTPTRILIAMLLAAGCSEERGGDVGAQTRPAP